MYNLLSSYLISSIRRNPKHTQICGSGVSFPAGHCFSHLCCFCAVFFSFAKLWICGEETRMLLNLVQGCISAVTGYSFLCRVRQLDIHVRANVGKQRWATDVSQYANNDVIIRRDVSLQTLSYANSADIAQPVNITFTGILQVKLHIDASMCSRYFTVECSHRTKD